MPAGAGAGAFSVVDSALTGTEGSTAAVVDSLVAEAGSCAARVGAIREVTGSACLGRSEGSVAEVVDSSREFLDPSGAATIGASSVLNGGELRGSSCSMDSFLFEIAGSTSSSFPVDIGANVGIGSRTGVSDTVVDSSLGSTSVPGALDAGAVLDFRFSSF